MITRKRLNQKGYHETLEIEANLDWLFLRLQKIEEAYGHPLFITSGLRSEADQKVLIAAGKTKATKSNHLIGAAADIADTDGEFHDWLKKNEALLIQLGLWCEERQGAWQHVQIYPPRSGKRWFNP